jgi:hypothetical protein
MQRHTVDGFNYLADGGIGDYVANHIAFQHHERQDGSGYPRGLRGANSLKRLEQDKYNRDRIHPLAEITAVADVYSAVSSDRPYRPALAPETAGRTIRELAGHHLNHEVVRCFSASIPVFPVGAVIQIEGGRYDGFRGVVVENRPGRLDKPTVRLTVDRRGALLDPDDFATFTDPDCELVTPEARRLAPVAG